MMRVDIYVKYFSPLMAGSIEFSLIIYWLVRQCSREWWGTATVQSYCTTAKSQWCDVFAQPNISSRRGFFPPHSFSKNKRKFPQANN